MGSAGSGHHAASVWLSSVRVSASVDFLRGVSGVPGWGYQVNKAEAAWPFVSQPQKKRSRRDCQRTPLAKAGVRPRTCNGWSWSPPLDWRRGKNRQPCFKLPQKVCQKRYPLSSIVKADGPSGEALPAEGPAYEKARAREQIVLHEVSPTRSPRSTPKTSFVPAHQAAVLCWPPRLPCCARSSDSSPSMEGHSAQAPPDSWGISELRE